MNAHLKLDYYELYSPIIQMCNVLKHGGAVCYEHYSKVFE